MTKVYKKFVDIVQDATPFLTMRDYDEDAATQLWSFQYSPTLFYIKSRTTGLVIDVFGGSHAPGTKVIVWNLKSNNNLNQLWRWNFDNTIASAQTGHVLEVTREFSRTIQTSKHTGAVNQQFTYDGGHIVCHDGSVCLTLSESTRELVVTSSSSISIEEWDLVPQDFS
jgi:hypothetical protein